MRLEDADVRQRVARTDRLLERVETLPDPDARSAAVEALQGLLELYGEGLARMVSCAATVCGAEAVQAFADDELISHLLLLHGLHPVDVETRVARALEGVRPQLASHGGDVALLGVEEGVARLRLLGSCQGCPSSSVTLRQTVEQALIQAAPDLLGIEVEESEPGRSGLVMLEVPGVG